MFLVIGLGNPGYRYRNTRHNIGFRVVEQLSSQWLGRFRRGNGPYRWSELYVDGETVLLVKPTTYMNRSGLAVKALLREFPVDPTHMLVICDDFQLPLGKLRLRAKGSHGGHNGLASVIQAVGTEKLPRLKLGIGLENSVNIVNYVLSPFPRRDRPAVKKMIGDGRQAVICFVQRGLDWTMNMVNAPLSAEKTRR